MKEEEGGIQKPEIRQCPYWQRFVVNGEFILALCGSMYEDAPEFGETDIGFVSPTCPLFLQESTKEAFFNPVILETSIKGLTSTRWRRDCAWSMGCGIDGIRELEERWDEEVAKFYKRHPL